MFDLTCGKAERGMEETWSGRWWKMLPLGPCQVWLAREAEDGDRGKESDRMEPESVKACILQRTLHLVYPRALLWAGSTRVAKHARLRGPLDCPIQPLRDTHLRCATRSSQDQE